MHQHTLAFSLCSLFDELRAGQTHADCVIEHAMVDNAPPAHCMLHDTSSTYQANLGWQHTLRVWQG